MPDGNSGQQAGGTGVPRPDRHLRGMSHEELKAWTDAGNPGVSEDLADQWGAMGDSLRDAGTRLQQAVAGSQAGWTGQAADAMRYRLEQVAQWSMSTGEGFSAASVAVRQQSSAVGEAKARMPEPVPYDPGKIFEDARKDGLLGIMALPQRLYAQKQKSDAAYNEALVTVAARDGHLQKGAGVIPAFTTPPALNDDAGGRPPVVPPEPGGRPPGGGPVFPGPSGPRPGGGGPSQPSPGGEPGPSGGTPGQTGPTQGGPGQQGPGGTVPGSHTGVPVLPGPSGAIGPGPGTPGGPGPVPGGGPGFGPGSGFVPGRGEQAGGKGARPFAGGPEGTGRGPGGTGEPGRGAGRAPGGPEGAGRVPGGTEEPGRGAGRGPGGGARFGAGGLTAAEAAAGRGGAGARGGGAGIGGVPLGAGTGTEDEDSEHRRPAWLVEDDPESLFGTDELTAPAVLGVDEDEE